MRAIQRDSPSSSIRMNSIAPSVTDSAMTGWTPSMRPDYLRVGIPVGTPEDTAKVSAFLAVNKSYNGHTISVDGQAYREVESGMERYTRDILGDHTEFAMTKEQ